MLEKIGKKLVRGATAEIAEKKPIQLFDKETLEGLGEMVVGVGLLALAAVLIFRRPRAETPVVINIIK